MRILLSVLLLLGGCVSIKRYEALRQQANERIRACVVESAAQGVRMQRVQTTREVMEAQLVEANKNLIMQHLQIECAMTAKTLKAVKACFSTGG